MTHKKAEEYRQLLLKWLEGDLVKSGYQFHTIERQNEAFARGWRWGIKSAMDKFEEIMYRVEEKKKKK